MIQQKRESIRKPAHLRQDSQSPDRRSPGRRNRSISSVGSARQGFSAEKEFFKLMVISIIMNHNFVISDKLMMKNPDEMYMRARIKGIMFH